MKAPERAPVAEWTMPASERKRTWAAASAAGSAFTMTGVSATTGVAATGSATTGVATGVETGVATGVATGAATGVAIGVAGTVTAGVA